MRRTRVQSSSTPWWPLLALILLATAARGRAQEVGETSVSGGPPLGRLSDAPTLGPSPGVMMPGLPTSPGSLQPNPFALDPGIITGPRRGPRRIARPNPRGFSRSDVQRPSRLPEALPGVEQPEMDEGPPAGDIADLVDDEGPPDGLTLDAAIERLRASNLDVLAIRYELPQAQADILTAGLRNNPLIYGDTQFLPYGRFSEERPGGPLQYDLNVTFPIDVSGKRAARVAVASAARQVLEAQFQDVARRQIGNLYRAFVDLQAARISLLASETMVARHEEVLERLRGGEGPGKPSRLEMDRLVLALARRRAGMHDVRDALTDAQEALGLLLALPDAEVARLLPRGRLRMTHPEPPSQDEAIAVAMRSRPDLIATRLGVRRADSEVRLARANRYDDVYVFYAPYIYQDNSPFGNLSARSWAVGMTFTVPIFNRNQGNIAKARANVAQSHAEVAALERRIAAEVRQAYREFAAARQALTLVETTVVAPARDATARATRGLLDGEVEVDQYLDHVEDDADAARMYRDAILRFRRAMLDLNTAVGARIMP
ncbi:TolC family protein [Paludisphaera sp.]|uniref:TolC family protein n=1 Tax=Paludisphaera sp. TaxID=2017432 RepID=UPI00301B8C62